MKASTKYDMIQSFTSRLSIFWQCLKTLSSVKLMTFVS